MELTALMPLRLSSQTNWLREEYKLCVSKRDAVVFFRKFET
jgi:hypothetical protein